MLLAFGVEGCVGWCCCRRPSLRDRHGQGPVDSPQPLSHNVELVHMQVESHVHWQALSLPGPDFEVGVKLEGLKAQLLVGLKLG